MKRLYNEYLAHTGAGNEIAQKVEEALKPVIDTCIQKDYDLRDMENVFSRTVTVMISERIITRAMNKKKATATPTTRMARLIAALRELKDIVQWEYDHDPEQEDLPSWKKVLDEAEELLAEAALKEEI